MSASPGSELVLAGVPAAEPEVKSLVNNSPLDWSIPGPAEVFALLGSDPKEGLRFKSLLPDGEYAVVVYYHGHLAAEFKVLLPLVEELGQGTGKGYGSLVYTGGSRLSCRGGLVRTSRLCHAMLVRRGTDWGFEGFWNLYYQALNRALTVASGWRKIDTLRLQSVFSSAISKMLATLEKTRNSAHAPFAAREIELAYPGPDSYQGKVGRDREVELQDVTEAFHQKALEIGCDLAITSKSNPGRRVFYIPGKRYSKAMAQLGIWPDFVCQARGPRECHSAVPGAQRLANDHYATPLVVSSEGRPDFMKGYMKFVNCAFFSFPSVVHNGVNSDEVVASGWVSHAGVMDTEEERFEMIPFAGESLAEMDILVREKYGEDAVVSLYSRQVDALMEHYWGVSYFSRKDCNGTYKVVSPADAAGKGMVQPTTELFVEKRDHENFYRPIFFILPIEAVKKKELGRPVLRMLTSRVPGIENKTLSPDIERGEYSEMLGIIRQQLAEVGDSGKSQIFRIEPGESTFKVMGFSGSPECVTAIPELALGQFTGKRVPVMTPAGAPLTAVVGELPITRQKEDDHFGDPIRLKSKGNGINLDVMACIGKPIEHPAKSDDVARAEFNDLVGNYRVIAQLQVAESEGYPEITE